MKSCASALPQKICAVIRRWKVVCDRAVGFADEHGTDALSMRKLAAELGYEVMSLYNHVANKAEVLSLMVDAVAAEIPLPDPDVDPIVAVRALAVDTRAALVRHPWAAGLWLRQLPGPARIDHMEHLLAALAATDMAPPVAHLAREEHVRVARRLVAAHSDLGAIVLECTNMPPYTADIQRETGLPVFDITTLVRMAHAALAAGRSPRPA